MLILGLESSCDETSASLVEDGWNVRSLFVHSQHDLHETYGGVVPEIASRAQLDWFVPAIETACAQAKVKLQDIDAVAVGHRPGLIGSLLVGVNLAKGISLALNKPLIGVDHVQAHLQAALLNHAEKPKFPALGLVASGGHTSLYYMHNLLDISLLGTTIDDAVGEAYDKAATILHAGYPGGMRMDQLAQQGDPSRVSKPLPRSMLAPDSLDFSFSGLKTALLYAVRGKPEGRGKNAAFMRSASDLSCQQRADLAAAFQHAAIGALTTKIRRAIKQLRTKEESVHTLLVGGGVVANSHLRSELHKLTQAEDIQLMLPDIAHCGDNAAMIAGLAFHRLSEGLIDDLALAAMPNTPLR